MKTTHKITAIYPLFVGETRLVPYQRTTVHGETYTLHKRLHDFEKKIEGERYVDGEKVSNWVQYK